MRSRSRSRWVAVCASVLLVGVAGVAVSGAGGSGAPVRAGGDVVSWGERAVFMPVVPCRLFDTRPAPDTVGARSTPLAAGETYTQQVTGVQGTCIVPFEALAVAMNVSVVQGTASSFLAVFPADVPDANRPVVSSVNWAPGSGVKNNKVDVRLSPSGAVKLFNKAGTVHVIADVVGYYADHDHDDRYYTQAEVDAIIADNSGANRISDEQIAMLRWDQDPGRMATISIDAFAAPTAVAYDGNSVWVTNSNLGTVSKIDPVANEITATVDVGEGPMGVAFDGSSVWVANIQSGTVSKIDPIENEVTATVALDEGVFGVAFDGSSVWVSNIALGTVSKIDPVANVVTATVTVGSEPMGMAFDGTYLWVANSGSNTVSKVNVGAGGEGVSATVGVGEGPRAIAFDGANLWVVNATSATVSKVDPRENEVIATATWWGGGPLLGVAFDGTHLWVTEAGEGAVVRLNPMTNFFDGGPFVPVGVWPMGVAFDGTNLWVANETSGTVSKLLPF